jgi:uncharacterized protein
VVSPSILDEYRRVAYELARGKPALNSAVDALLALIAVHASVVDSPTLPQQVTADPDDEQFVASALAGAATYIVSGDKHLLAVSGWSGISVVTPRGFVDGVLNKREH